MHVQLKQIVPKNQ